MLRCIKILRQIAWNPGSWISVILILIHELRCLLGSRQTTPSRFSFLDYVNLKQSKKGSWRSENATPWFMQPGHGRSSNEINIRGWNNNCVHAAYSYNEARARGFTQRGKTWAALLFRVPLHYPIVYRNPLVGNPSAKCGSIVHTSHLQMHNRSSVRLIEGIPNQIFDA